MIRSIVVAALFVVASCHHSEISGPGNPGDAQLVTTDIENLQDGATALITPALAGAHQDEMPLEYHLLSFPPIPSKG